MSKKILIFANQVKASQELKQELIEKMATCSNLTLVDKQEVPDYIITIGGDGTLLSAFHEYKHLLNTVQFIGIHTGHLGFYTDWLDTEIDTLVDDLSKSSGSSVSYPLLEATIDYQDGRTSRQLALNEVSIRPHHGTIVCDILVKDEYFETVRGDGLCISTPTGSTGLNKSHGGAVIHPRVEAIQLTKMGAINNRVYRSMNSPMVIPRDEWFVIKPTDRTRYVTLAVDNFVDHQVEIASIRLQIASERIQFASFRHMHYWDRVENAFIGNKKDELKRD
ncbi:NAD kinase [Hutsoniella sourekii]|uniref:NAD kinase n=1 Tax=Hutsoniella sourekii TaxID=87650 RepID=UPI000484EC79|nr:NAD kinase [Hutsoniella sourekii]